MNIPLQKQILRQQLKKIRTSLPPWYQQRASNCVQSLIMDLPEYKQAQHIALYRGIQQEILLDDIWLDAEQQGKLCSFPKLMDNKNLNFITANTKNTFTANSLGILEPVLSSLNQELVNAKKIDVFIIPLVAFDDQGHRLGMGLGCYDRALTNHPESLIIGVAYAFQQVALVPVDQHDLKVDLIVTEQGIIHPIKGNNANHRK